MEQLKPKETSPLKQQSPQGHLSREDMQQLDSQELLVLYKQTGDEAIKWEIVLRYTEQVKMVAFQTRGLFSRFAQLEDVVNEGVLVLANAVEKFDVTKEIKFDTYIAKRLRGMMIDLARKQDWVPRQVRQNVVRLNRVTKELTEQLGYAPSGKEIAERMGISKKEYDELQINASASNFISFESMLETYGTEAGSKESLLSKTPEGLPEDTYLEKELHRILAQGVASLREHEQLVLSLYYEKELSMKEIAGVLDVSAPRVSQIHSSAIRHLRSFMENYLKE